YAFLAGSTAVRNSDFWLHLASGRLVASGQYRFGVDPFSYTTRDVYWTNHAWLFDAGLYWLHRAGDSAVPIAQGLFTAVLAWLLMRFSVKDDSGTPRWIAPLCTALAILALSPRLAPRSDLASFLLVPLTLWLLCHLREGSYPSSRLIAALLILWMVWGN